MSEDLTLRLDIVGQDQASIVLRGVVETLQRIEKQAIATGTALKTSLGPELLKSLATVRTEAKDLGSDLVEAAERAARALRADVSAVTELRTALRGAASDERALGRAMRATHTVGTGAVRLQATATQNAASTRSTAAAADLRAVRQRWRVREASERAERREVEATGKAWAAEQRQRIRLIGRSEAMEQARQRHAARSEARAIRDAATARANAERDTFGDIRSRWRLREASMIAERRETEQASATWAVAQRRRMGLMDRSAAVESRHQREADRVEAARARAETVATDRRIRDVGRVWRLRERSEAAEARHVASMRREREATRRRAMTAGRHAYGHAHHAVRSVNHPVLQSPGFWLHAGAVFGIEAGRHMLDAARSIDAATALYKMMPGVSTADAAAVRANALREGMRIGLDPAEVVRLQLQGMKDGLSKDVAASLPAIVNAAVQTMGGDLNRDGDELAKAVREASTVGWVKDAAGARSLMNSVAGLSTFNGNSPEKMQQFLASGGIGRGKELGWTRQETLAFGAALNGSGERTGLGSARLMAQIPEIRAGMRDRYLRATRSHENTEENRAIRSAPRLMAYGSVREMQNAFATPEGVTDFLSRLGKLPEQTRAAIEKGYGLGPQFNAVAAEMGADHGARYHQAFQREQQLSSQNAGNDDLSKNSKIWSGSIDFMVGQIKASVSAVQSEIGDVIKEDILAPFTGWWVNISEALLNGGMKADLHRAILAFVNGLGFDDLTAALNALRASVGTFDFAGFMRGVGVGARVVMDDLKSFASVFSGPGGLSAETVGKLAAELFGLSAALHVIAPVATIIGGMASAFLALKSAIEGVAWLSRLAGLTGAVEALGAVEGVAGAAAGTAAAGALLPVMLAAVGVGALAVTVMNFGAVLDGIRDLWSSATGGRDRSESFSAQVRQHARAAAGDDVEAQKRWTLQHRPRDYDAAWGHHGRDADGTSTPAADQAAEQNDRRRALGLDGAGESADKLRAAIAFDRGLLGLATAEKAAHIREEIDLLQQRLDAILSARPAAPQPVPATPAAPTIELPAMPMRLEGGENPNDWRNLFTRAAYEPSDSGDVARNAALDTARGVVEVREAVDRLGLILRTATVSGSGSVTGGGSGGAWGAGGGTGVRGDTPNLRYGRRAGGGGNDGSAYRNTPDGSPVRARGQLAANQTEAYKGFLEEGFNPTAARALVANDSGESLANPSNYHWDRRHMSGGIVQWDPARAAAIKAKFGDVPWKLPLRQQVAAQAWEIRNNPRFAATNRALQGTDGRAMIGALVANYESPADIPGNIAARMGRFNGFHPGEVGPGGVSGPVSAPTVGAHLADLKRSGLLSDEQCVTLAMASVGIRKGSGVEGANVHDWRRGGAVTDGTLTPGTPVATFLNRHGGLSDRYAGGGAGTPGAGLDHAGRFESYIRDGAGKIVGMKMLEQYQGSGGQHVRNYLFGQGRGEHDGANYYRINTRSGAPLGGRPSIPPETAKAADIVKAAHDAPAIEDVKNHRLRPGLGDTSSDAIAAARAAVHDAGSAAKAVDIADSLDGMGDKVVQSKLGQYMHKGEWCTDFVNGALGKAGLKGTGSAWANSFRKWGQHVDMNDVKRGDVILEDQGTDLIHHTGFATGAVKRDPKTGEITHIGMTSGNHGDQVVKDYWEPKRLVTDLRRAAQDGTKGMAGKPAASPADITRKVTGGTGSRPGAGDTPADSVTKADNSTMTNHFHIHPGVHDPHAVARTVVAHLDRMNSRYTDSESVA